MYSLEEFSEVVSAAVGPLPGEGVFSEHVRHHVVLALWLEEGLALDVVVVLHVQPTTINHTLVSNFPAHGVYFAD
jgi:hypothetical protein